MENINGDEQSGNMYAYNDDISNQQSKDSNSIKRSKNEEDDNPYKISQRNQINKNEEQNVEQNAIRRSIGDKNPNIDEFPNYVEKSSEQRFPNLQESHSPFEMNHPPVIRKEQYQIQLPQPRDKKKFYLINYLLIFLLQVVIIILIALSFEFDGGEPTERNKDEDSNFAYLYHFFKDVHLMIFIGFGFLYTALKDHQWSSIGIILFIGTISFEISFLWNHLWHNTFIIKYRAEMKGWSKTNLNFDILTQIDYTAATVFISLGALIGKLSICQYIIISICETFFSSLNYYLCYYQIGGIDNGGSLYIHAFGAIFGIVIAITVFCRSKEYTKIINNPHLNSDYYSNAFSFIGSLFLWLYFPSFNISKIQSKELKEEKEEEKNIVINIMGYRGIINTYLSMIGSVIGTFVVSPLVSNGKFKMEHLLNASYVGGIIIGGCCTICSSAWGAILIGFIGGCISVLGLWFLKKKLKELKLEDTFGILYTFGIPGILGGFLNSIFMGNFRNESWGGKEIKDFFNFDRSPSMQGGIQVAVIFITIAIAGAAGITIGFIIRSTNCEKNEIYFVDSENYIEDENIPLPEWKYSRQNDINLNSSGNKLDENK